MNETTQRLYDLVARLPQHDYRATSRDLPRNGVYFFFEVGETINLRGEPTDRITRVGINTADGRFPGRIRDHYGPLKPRSGKPGGNKNASAFRRHFGGAVLRSIDPYDPRIAEWVKQGGKRCIAVEEHVTKLMREILTFAYLRVDERDDREDLESGLIAILAQHPIGSPSERWLGHFAQSDNVRRSGLWNSDHVDDDPLTQSQIQQLEDVASEQQRNRQ